MKTGFIRCAVVAFAGGLFAGCTTLVVPVPSICPIPEQTLVACNGPSKQALDAANSKLRELSKSIDSTQSLNDVKNLIYPEASKQGTELSILWIDAFNRCEAQRSLIAKMINGCNENAEVMRPRILKAVTP